MHLARRTSLLAVPFLILAVFANAASGAASGTVSTLVGSPGVSGPALGVSGQPGALATYSAQFFGDFVYVLDGSQHVIRQIDQANGNETTFAGNGGVGVTGDGAAALQATLGIDAYGATVTVDYTRDIVFSASNDDEVRMVAGVTCTGASNCPYGFPALVAGNVYTVAGTGSATPTADAATAGDGGAASAATLNSPRGVTIDYTGGTQNIVIADTGNARVRFVAGVTCSSNCAFGRTSTIAGHIYNVAGTGPVAGQSETGDGGAATSAVFGGPTYLTEDDDRNLLISDGTSGAVRVVARTTAVPYLATPTVVGNVYRVAGAGGTAATPGNGTSAVAAQIAPGPVAIDNNGGLLIGTNGFDSSSFGDIYLVSGANCNPDCDFGLTNTAPGSIYHVAGTGGSGAPVSGAIGTATPLGGVRSLAIDSTGSVLFSDPGSFLVSGTVRKLARQTCAATCPYGVTTTANHVYTVGFTGHYGTVPDGNDVANTSLGDPRGGAVNAQGDVLVGENFEQRISVRAGTTCSTGATCPWGRSMTAGHVYTVAGTGSSANNTSNDVVGTSNAIDSINDVVFDAAGDAIFGVGNYGSGFGRIAIVPRASCAAGDCLFGAGAETAGRLYTVAGNPTDAPTSSAGNPLNDDIAATASGAHVRSASGLAFDAAGNLFFAEGTDDIVRMVANTSCTASCAFGIPSITRGHLYTVAGTGLYSDGSGNHFVHPSNGTTTPIPDGVQKIAVDARGDVIIPGAFGSNSLQVAYATACSGTCPYGPTSAAAGALVTIAGGPAHTDPAADGVPAATTAFGGTGVVVDAAGDIVYANLTQTKIALIAAEDCTSNCPWGLPSLTTGTTTTLAGADTRGLAGDGASAASAAFGSIEQLSLAPDGTLVITDRSNSRIRALSPTGSFAPIIPTPVVTPITTPGPAAPVTPVVVPQPILRLVATVGALAKTTTLTSTRKQGLSNTVTVNQAAKVTSVLTVPAATAKALGLLPKRSKSKAPFVVGAGHAVATKAGTVVLRTTLTAKAKRTFAHLRTVKLTESVTITAGASHLIVTRTVKLALPRTTKHRAAR